MVGCGWGAFVKRRNLWRFFDYHVHCECGWEAYGVNGLGIAAQHHDRTGHTVNVGVTGSVTYASEADDARFRRDKSLPPKKEIS